MIFNNKTDFINLCADETGVFHRINNYDDDITTEGENQQICLLFKNSVDGLLHHTIWNFAISLPGYLTFNETLDMPIYKEKWISEDNPIRISNVRLNEDIVKDKNILCTFQSTGALIRGNNVYLQIETKKYIEHDDVRVPKLIYADITQEPEVALWPEYFTDLVKFDFTYKVTHKLFNGGGDDLKHFSELELRIKNAKMLDVDESNVPLLSVNWYNE